MSDHDSLHEPLMRDARLLREETIRKSIAWSTPRKREWLFDLAAFAVFQVLVHAIELALILAGYGIWRLVR